MESARGKGFGAYLSHGKVSVCDLPRVIWETAKFGHPGQRCDGIDHQVKLFRATFLQMIVDEQCSKFDFGEEGNKIHYKQVRRNSVLSVSSFISVPTTRLPKPLTLPLTASMIFR